MHDLAKIIEEICTARGWSHAALSRELGVTDQSIGNWILGRSRPRERYLRALSVLHATPATPPDPKVEDLGEGYVAQLLYSILKHTRWTQSELCQRLSVRQQQLASWLRDAGMNEKSRAKLEALAATLPGLEYPSVLVPAPRSEWMGRMLEIRKRRGWNSSKAAEQFGVSRQAYSQWENGVITPSRRAKEEIVRLEQESNIDPTFPSRPGLEEKLNDALARIERLEKIVRLRRRLAR